MRGRIVGVLALVITAASVAGVWLWSSHRRADSEDREIAALKSRLEGSGGNADEHYRLGLHLCEHEAAAEGLAHLELAAEKEPANLLFGNAVRIYSRRHKEYDRSIRFFERLAATNGDLPEPRVQLALAYVDKMPDHMMGIVGQGKLSKQSITILNRVLDAPAGAANKDTRWAALYALAMNHLYWPKALRHAGAAEEAFHRCLEYQKAMSTSAGPRGTPSPAQGEASRPDSASVKEQENNGPLPAYFMLAYLGLGDALAKQGRLSEARDVWREAQKTFPNEPRLAERLSLEDDARLTDLIDRVRGLGVVVDTDLSVLWGRRP